MRNVDRLIHALKRMNPNMLSYDEQGRILLKNKFDLTSTVHFNSATSMNRVCPPVNKMSNDLFHPEESVIRKNIYFWLDELFNQYRELVPTSSSYFVSLAKLFNMTALLFCLLGQADCARALCHKQIDFFVGKARSYPLTLKFIIQPWINLGRLDKQSNDYQAAQCKFATLQFEKNTQFVAIGEHHLSVNNLFMALDTDKKLKQVVQTCAVLEPIKIHLRQQNYQTLLSYAEQFIHHPLLTTIALEACLIAETNLGFIAEARERLNSAIAQSSPRLLPYFLLRKMEFQAITRDNTFKKLAKKMLDLIHYFDINTITLNQTLLTLRAAKLLMTHVSLPYALQAYQKAYRFAEALGDEYCQLLCLAQLRCTQDSLFKDRFASLLAKTGYAGLLQQFAPEKMAANLTFHAHKAHWLFEQLMSL